MAEGPITRVLFGFVVYAGLYMQQYKMHTNFQTLPLYIQVQEQSKSKKEMALSSLGEETRQGK